MSRLGYRTSDRLCIRQVVAIIIVIVIVIVIIRMAESKFFILLLSLLLIRRPLTYMHIMHACAERKAVSYRDDRAYGEFNASALSDKSIETMHMRETGLIMLSLLKRECDSFMLAPLKAASFLRLVDIDAPNTSGNHSEAVVKSMWDERLSWTYVIDLPLVGAKWWYENMALTFLDPGRVMRNMRKVIDNPKVLRGKYGDWFLRMNDDKEKYKAMTMHMVDTLEPTVRAFIFYMNRRHRDKADHLSAQMCPLNGSAVSHEVFAETVADIDAMFVKLMRSILWPEAVGGQGREWYRQSFLVRYVYNTITEPRSTTTTPTTGSCSIGFMGAVGHERLSVSSQPRLMRRWDGSTNLCEDAVQRAGECDPKVIWDPRAELTSYGRFDIVHDHTLKKLRAFHGGNGLPETRMLRSTPIDEAHYVAKQAHKADVDGKFYTGVERAADIAERAAERAADIAERAAERAKGFLHSLLPYVYAGPPPPAAEQTVPHQTSRPKPDEGPPPPQTSRPEPEDILYNSFMHSFSPPQHAWSPRQPAYRRFVPPREGPPPPTSEPRDALYNAFMRSSDSDIDGPLQNAYVYTRPPPPPAEPPPQCFESERAFQSNASSSGYAHVAAAEQSARLLRSRDTRCFESEWPVQSNASASGFARGAAEQSARLLRSHDPRCLDSEWPVRSNVSSSGFANGAAEQSALLLRSRPRCFDSEWLDRSNASSSGFAHEGGVPNYASNAAMQDGHRETWGPHNRNSNDGASGHPDDGEAWVHYGSRRGSSSPNLSFQDKLPDEATQRSALDAMVSAVFTLLTYNPL